MELEHYRKGHSGESASGDRLHAKCYGRPFHYKGSLIKPARLNLGLLRCCRRIYDDAALLPFAENTFVFTTMNDALNPLLSLQKFLGLIVREQALAIRSLYLRFMDPTVTIFQVERKFVRNNLGRLESLYCEVSDTKSQGPRSLSRLRSSPGKDAPGLGRYPPLSTITYAGHKGSFNPSELPYALFALSGIAERVDVAWTISDDGDDDGPEPQGPRHREVEDVFYEMGAGEQSRECERRVKAILLEQNF